MNIHPCVTLPVQSLGGKAEIQNGAAKWALLDPRHICPSVSLFQNLYMQKDHEFAFFYVREESSDVWVLYPFKASCLFKFLVWNVRECNISLFHRTMISGAVIKVSEFRVLHIHSNINSMQNNGGNMLIFKQSLP